MAAQNPIDFNDFLTGEEVLKTAARSVRSLRKDVGDLSKTFTEDSARIKQGFTDIATAIKDLQGKGLKLNLVSDADKKLLNEYIQQVGALKTQKLLLKETEAAQAAAAKAVTDATKQQSDALKQLKADFQAAVKAGDAEAQKRTAAAIRQQTQENRQLSQALRGVNSEFTAAKGSYDALVLVNNNLLGRLRALEGGLDSTSKEAAELRTQIAANTLTLTQFDKSVNQSFRNVGNYPKALQAAGQGALGLAENLSGVSFSIAGAGVAVAGAVKQIFDSNVLLSDQLADVRKTTGLTADEVERLADNLKGLDTRTSLSGLLDIAKVGGQLGIAKNDIFEFTKAVDVANQALADDFKGSAEEIATELGKIAGVFRKELGPDVAQNLLAIGSAVNELGAEGAATAPFLADVALRVGAVASQSGVGLKNVLAYAAVLQETGFSAEVSGTALNRFFSVLSTRTKESFEIARKANPALTLKEFTNLVNTDFNGAIQSFLRGLRAGGKTTTELSGLLATLKLQSGEAKNAIITLSQNTDLFAQRQETANTQLREATSLAEEAAIKNSTLAAEVEKSKNTLSELTTNGPIADGLRSFFRDLRLDIEYTAAGFGKLGQFITSIKEKLGIVKPPLEDFTKGLVGNTQALNKQADAQQKLLDSYTALAAEAGRSGDQERELSQLRSQLQQQFGTTEAAAIQESINRNRLRAESNVKSLQAELAGYDRSTEELKQKSAAYQDALTLRSANFTKEQIAQAQKIAAARLDGPKLSGKSAVPELEGLIATNLKLLQVERLLTTQQTNRGFVLEALRKLGIINNQVTQAATTATEEQAEAEETLDRAAKARSDRRRADLEAELAENRRRIAAIRKYQAEQNRLFENGQINRQQFAEAVAGVEDAVSQLERDGTALRIRIAKEETTGKLAEIENERVRLSNKKKITQAEISDIEEAAGEKRIQAVRERERKIAQIQREGVERLEVKPIDIIPVQATGLTTALQAFPTLQKIILDREDNIQRELNKRFALRLLTQDGYDRKSLQNRKESLEKQLALEKQFGKETNRTQREIEEVNNQIAMQAAAERRRITQDVADGLTVIEGTYFAFRAQKYDEQLERLQYNYDREIRLAGENAELKEALEEEFDRKTRAIKRKQAINDRNAALFQVVINTAVQASQTGGIYDPRFYIALANGAAQTALILSKELPAYFKGREGGPAEWAQVAERGPELVVSEGGGARLVEKPSVTYLQKGDSVLTAQQTREALALATRESQALQLPMQNSYSLAASTVVIQQGRPENVNAEHYKQLASIAKGQKQIASALQNIKQLTVNVDQNGISSTSMRRGLSLVEYANLRHRNMGR